MQPQQFLKTAVGCFNDAEEQMFRADIFIFQLGSDCFRGFQSTRQRRVQVDIDVIAFHPRLLIQIFLQTGLQGIHIHAHLLEKRRDDAVLQIAERQQKMFLCNLLVTAIFGHFISCLHG